MAVRTSCVYVCEWRNSSFTARFAWGKLAQVQASQIPVGRTRDLPSISVHTPHSSVSAYLNLLEILKARASAVARTPDLPVHRPFG